MTRLLPWLALVLSLAVAAVRAQDEQPEQDPPKKGDEQEELKKRTREMQEEMTSVRGLKFKVDVKLGIYTKDELIDFVKRELEKELPREKAARWQKTYAHFGLIPKDLDLYDAFVDLYASSIAGFYHPKTKEMRLIRPGAAGGDPAEKLFEKSLGVKMEDITLVHELCHAAQDQNFELTTLPMEEETNDDLVAAIKGLVEGDASAVGWKYGLKDRFDFMIKLMNDSYKSGQLPGKGGDLPAYLRKTLTFPYGHGTDFVLAVWRHSKEDWEAVSKMFEDPPSSTEQILHPKKYYQERDNPTVIAVEGIDKIVGAGAKELVSNVHGEYAIKILLQEFKAQRSREIDKVTAGWDGDRYHTFEKDGAIFSVWLTTWDSEDDAREFFEGYAKLIEAKYEGARKDASDQKVTFDATKKRAGHALIERRSADVLVLDGADPGLLEKANAIWSAVKKVELKKVERVKLLYHCPNHAGEDSSKPGKCGACGAELKKKEEKKDY